MSVREDLLRSGTNAIQLVPVTRQVFPGQSSAGSWRAGAARVARALLGSYKLNHVATQQECFDLASPCSQMG